MSMRLSAPARTPRFGFLFFLKMACRRQRLSIGVTISLQETDNETGREALNFQLFSGAGTERYTSRREPSADDWALRNCLPCSSAVAAHRVVPGDGKEFLPHHGMERSLSSALMPGPPPHRPNAKAPLDSTSFCLYREGFHSSNVGCPSLNDGGWRKRNTTV